MNGMSLRCGARKTLLLTALAAAAPLASAATRLTVALDAGATVTVDNISTMSEATVRSLVLAADRSTQDGCPYAAPDRKGLIRSGDRVVVSDRYIAWLDVTSTDGVSFPSGFPSKYTRSGELAGYWTLDPATQGFKFLVSADARHCANWAQRVDPWFGLAGWREVLVGPVRPADRAHDFGRDGVRPGRRSERHEGAVRTQLLTGCAERPMAARGRRPS